MIYKVVAYSPFLFMSYFLCSLKLGFSVLCLKLSSNLVSMYLILTCKFSSETWAEWFRLNRKEKFIFFTEITSATIIPTNWMAFYSAESLIYKHNFHFKITLVSSYKIGFISLHVFLANSFFPAWFLNRWMNNWVI